MSLKKVNTANKIALIALSIVTVGAIGFGVGHAAWIFNNSNETTLNNGVQVPTWEFQDPLPIEEGQVIRVDNNGKVYIDDVEVPGASITYPDGQNPVAAGGSISYEIGVVDGELEVIKYTGTNLCNSYIVWVDNDAVTTLPSSITINGQSYAIKGLYEPLNINIERPLPPLLSHLTCTINVPEGYHLVCDDAFQNITSNRTLEVNINLPASLEYLGNHAFKMNNTNVTTNISFAGTTTQFIDLIAASAAEYGGGYTFFTGATGNVTISCSNGSVVYNRNGQYVP